MSNCLSWARAWASMHSALHVLSICSLCLSVGLCLHIHLSLFRSIHLVIYDPSSPSTSPSIYLISSYLIYPSSSFSLPKWFGPSLWSLCSYLVVYLSQSLAVFQRLSPLSFYLALCVSLLVPVSLSQSPALSLFLYVFVVGPFFCPSLSSISPTWSLSYFHWSLRLSHPLSLCAPSLAPSLSHALSLSLSIRRCGSTLLSVLCLIFSSHIEISPYFCPHVPLICHTSLAAHRLHWAQTRRPFRKQCLTRLYLWCRGSHASDGHRTALHIAQADDPYNPWFHLAWAEVGHTSHKKGKGHQHRDLPLIRKKTQEGCSGHA